MIDARSIVGTHDIVLITLDTLRFDVAQESWAAGKTPNLNRILPTQGWEARHSPGSFTYAAHHAIFAGFFPTPATPGRHPRLFAAQFPGSETTSTQTVVFDTPDIVSGLALHGYHTVCIGGVGFFNKQSALGNVLPGLFAESHWRSDLGVTNPNSTRNQVALAIEILSKLDRSQRVFLFINVSAIHQPNYMYLPGASADTLESHAAALAYVDSQLPPLFTALQQRAPALAILCADHGTAYGEDGYIGHRLAHPVVWTVPYAEVILPEQTS